MHIGFHVIEDRATLREASPLLQEGIESIHAKGMSHSVGFGDVYVGIVQGDLNVTLTTIDGNSVGFFVTQVVPRHGGGLELLLAYVYMRPRLPLDLTPHVVKAFEDQAKAALCQRVVFRTTRKGWERRLRPYGYAEVAVELSRNMEN